MLRGEVSFHSGGQHAFSGCSLELLPTLVGCGNNPAAHSGEFVGSLLLLKLFAPGLVFLWSWLGVARSRRWWQMWRPVVQV